MHTSMCCYRWCLELRVREIYMLGTVFGIHILSSNNPPSVAFYHYFYVMPSWTLKIVNKQEILVSQCFFSFFLLGHHRCCYCLMQSTLGYEQYQTTSPFKKILSWIYISCRDRWDWTALQVLWDIPLKNVMVKQMILLGNHQLFMAC